MIRCELLVDGYAYDVTDDLVNWDEVEIAWKRSSFSGVVRNISTKWEFGGGTYSLLIEHWRTQYMEASASVVIYRRNNSWLWDEAFRCSLDFSTFSYDSVTCTINAIDDSLASLIKAKNGTQYEYSVAGMSTGVLKYDRLNMKNNVRWTGGVSGEPEDHEYGLVVTNGEVGLPVYVESSEIVSRNLIEVYDVTFGETVPFIVGISQQSVHLKGEFTLDLYNVFSGSVVLKSKTGGGEFTELERYYVTPMGGANMVKIDKVIEVMPGMELYLTVGFTTTSGNGYLYNMGGKMEMSFTAKGETLDIPAVTPAVLLNRLLKSMNSGSDGLTGKIEGGDERLDHTVLVAAESIRGIPYAKLYTSYNKFKNWMEAEFGYVPVVNDKTVTFVHRDTLFSNTKTKEIVEYTDFESEVDQSLMYSRVRVGYDKVDYDSVNGKDEFRFTQEYTTGVTMTDNTLELISPYRADAYGIELLAGKRGEDTTDNESDNDLFMVGVDEGDGGYTLRRDVGISGVLDAGSMFNAMYSQYHMLMANLRYVGVCCRDVLSFASSDGNSSVEIEGYLLSSDFPIKDLLREVYGGALFRCDTLKVTTGDLDIPDDMSVIVKVKRGGLWYHGYILDVSENIGREDSVTYTLQVHDLLK